MRDFSIMVISPFFWSKLFSYRFLHIGGPMGTGKTLLSVAIAELLHYRFGYRVWSNFPCSFSESFDSCSDSILPRHTVILLDECANYLGARNWRNNDLSGFAYLRKLDCIVLLSGVQSVDKQLRLFYVERRLHPWFSDWIWFYHCETESGELFPLTLLAPGCYFSVYSHLALDDPALFYYFSAIMSEMAHDSELERVRREREVSSIRSRLSLELEAFRSESASV